MLSHAPVPCFHLYVGDKGLTGIKSIPEMRKGKYGTEVLPATADGQEEGGRRLKNSNSAYAAQQ